MSDRITIVLVRTNKLDQFIKEYMNTTYNSISLAAHRVCHHKVRIDPCVIYTRFSIRTDDLNKHFCSILNGSKKLVAKDIDGAAYRLTQLKRKTLSKYLEGEINYVQDLLKANDVTKQLFSISTLTPALKACWEDRLKMYQNAKYTIDTWCLTDDNKEDNYWTIVAGVE